MVGPSKILTVSYGTFSCTLEGFDDPFSTMRGIAEYFRDLAADDRYFGAEPPTPDAEMLHRIAENEIQKRVEAKVSATGIVLRQAEEEPQTAQPEIAVEEIADQASEQETSQSANAKDDVASQADVASLETVAERLARIRALAEDHDQDFAEEGDNVATQAGSIQAAFEEAEDEAADVEPVQEVAQSDFVEAADQEPRVTLEEDEFSKFGADENVETDEVSFEEVEETEEDASDVNVLKLVSSHFAGSDDDDAEEEFKDGENTFVEPSAEDWSEAEAEAEADAQAQTDVDEVEPSNAAADEADEATDSEAEEEVLAPAEEVAAGSETFAELMRSEQEAAAQEEQAASEQDTPDEQEMVSRLLKMRLNDFEASVQNHENAVSQAALNDDEIIEAELVEEAKEAEPINALSDLDEQDEDHGNNQDDDDKTMTLVLADVAEVLETETPDQSSDAEPTPEELIAKRRSERPISRPEGVRVERLLEVTNNEMADGEGSRRRSAIAHLKAAVAATRADRLEAKRAKDDFSANGALKEDIDAYRDDLARVVRPRRLEESDRPTSRRMPPLMLVSEQRIDDVESATDTPSTDVQVQTQPRALTDEPNAADQDENIFSESGSFAEFAREMGAVELPDLLEAAGAYYHYVEGQPHFSRPQIMNAVAGMEDADDFSREERLRSFGMLLRRGKIRKIRRGQFEIADTTRFRPELRAGE